MRVKWNHIKLTAVLGLTVFVFVFALDRNNRRLVDTVAVYFDDESTPFVTRETVNKLLIQSNEKVTGTPKEKLALREMEARVKAHPIIRNADVYVTMSGQLGVTIQQRKPIARLNGESPFYIDQNGEKMPLSANFAAHVPLVSGASEKNMKEIFDLVSFVKEDAFLSKHIIGIERAKGGNYVLIGRKTAFRIVLGKVENLESKFSNYMAFFQKAKKDQTLDNYKTINLMYANQVVCEKK